MLRSAIDVLAVFDLDRPDPPPVALEAEPPIEPLGYSVAEEIERHVAEAVATVRAEERADAEWQLTEALAEQARSLRAEHEAARKAWVEYEADRIATGDRCAICRAWRAGSASQPPARSGRSSSSASSTGRSRTSPTASGGS